MTADVTAREDKRAGMKRQDRLGRGLGALLGHHIDQIDDAAGGNARPPAEVEVRAIIPNPFQPRREFGEDELGELAASISANGLLQPVVVRRRSGSGQRFELVAGERRLRAVEQLGWRTIPAQVRDMDDRTLLVLALVENIQREDLSPMEEARGYGQLREQFGLRQRDVAEAVGKSRSTVANALRLLTLPPSVQRLLEDGVLTMGHGRALAGIGDAMLAADTARAAVEGSWSVRETEERVRRLLAGTDGEADEGTEHPEPTPDPAIGVLQDALGTHLDTRVSIQWRGEGTGAIRIRFNGPRELERVFAAVTGREVADVLD